MNTNERCEPPLELRERIARAIHEGLGESWAYCNYGGDEWNSCRYMLDDAADKVLAIVTPPATVAALVEALENLMDVQTFATGWDNGVTDATGTMNEGDHWHGLAMDRARAVLALYREVGVMSVVTEEMVEIATLAAINKRRAAIKVPPLVSLVGLQIPGGSNALEIDAMRAALAAVAPIIAKAKRERVKKLVANECENLMQRTKTPIKRAREDGHLSEKCHQESRWHGVNDLREWAEKIGPAAIRALGDAT